MNANVGCFSELPGLDWSYPASLHLTEIVDFVRVLHMDKGRIVQSPWFFPVPVALMVLNGAALCGSEEQHEQPQCWWPDQNRKWSRFCTWRKCPIRGAWLSSHVSGLKLSCLCTCGKPNEPPQCWWLEKQGERGQVSARRKIKQGLPKVHRT